MRPQNPPGRVGRSTGGIRDGGTSAPTYLGRTFFTVSRSLAPLGSRVLAALGAAPPPGGRSDSVIN